ncbi:MAG: hypothetical protein P1U36_04985 [Legionellaceae bacterium]|nr:hypothetical protein [Legionellaceae bacterium]
MPVVSRTHIKGLCDFKRTYQNVGASVETSNALTKALNAMDDKNPSLESAWRVYNAYVSAPTPTEQNLREAHDAFSKSFFGQALSALQEHKLLIGPHAQSYFDAVVSQNDSYGIANALVELKKLGFLNEENTKPMLLMLAHIKNPTYFSYVLQFLGATGLLSGEYAQANLNLVASHHNQSELCQALTSAQKQGFLQEEHAQEDLKLIASHQDPSSLVEALGLIQEHAEFNSVDALLSRYEIAEQPQPMCFVPSFIMLHSLGLLDGEQGEAYRARITEPQCSMGFDSLIFSLDEANLLEEDSADLTRQMQQIMAYSTILFSDGMHQAWAHIPEHLFTQETWNHIRQLCRANQINPEAGRVHLERYILHDLLGIEREQDDALNQAQSTHTASVHQTVSDSAKRLSARYGTVIVDLEDELEKIETWVNAQEGHDIEQRAIQKLAHASHDFKDPTSGITTKQLLAFAWSAIHDDEQRQGSKDDAKNLFLQGLYEIQRAYNLSDDFEDRDGADKAACASGTFNKIIEKLVGIHPEVELKYITPQGAMLKLMPLIRQAAQAYLKNQDQDIEKLTVEILKNTIRSLVREQFLFEFSSEPDLTALTHDYQTFEIFQASEDYAAFQILLQQEQDIGLELMVSGKLDLADEELDDVLQGWIALAEEQSLRAVTPKGVDELTEEVVNQPLSREAIRDIRRTLFEKRQALDNDEPDDTSPSI